ncbi:hypothetical protein A1O3_10086 [Capronia epimyces CBS 606.96]|uniref:DUF7924 domain-containing protein n=1 Tax=Capronia epimyces CBS 606.96 TaxID=1182542 RepID=W9Y3A6_9EURO|nr:uncharacterized protein A1O3_10086 [Capronia epimyces CBS 606.96]EXJ76929.1 hypothetical protein A1O3_10086 [Capronia epimyces CBS 606.96]
MADNDAVILQSQPIQSSSSSSRPPTKSQPAEEEVEYVEEWTEKSTCSRTVSSESRDLRQSESSSDSDDSEALETSSDRTLPMVSDTTYRETLMHHNIYINSAEPTPGLMARAKMIVSQPQAVPDLDSPDVQQIIEQSRLSEAANETSVRDGLVPVIIPARRNVPDPRLTVAADQLWCLSIPPPDCGDEENKYLRQPKPDLAFGYTRNAFTKDQNTMIRSSMAEFDNSKSYAVPAQGLNFPFLSIEFKSQANQGTHFAGQNQAAGAGAIAMNGIIELTKRAFGVEVLDYDEPQFFSVVMDHELARINVHWLKAPTQEGQLPDFHLTTLSRHFLDEPDGIQAVYRAIYNILFYGVDGRLSNIHKALDKYHKVVHGKKAAAGAKKGSKNGAKKVLRKILRKGFS